MEIPKELLPYLLGQKKDASSLQDSLFRISITFAVLVTVSTVLRVWVRMRLVRNVGLDDVLMIVAFTFAILLSASCLIGRHFGLGLHIWNLTPNLNEIAELTPRITKSLYGAYLSYALAIAFVKFSIIATYFRIFGDSLFRRIASGVGIIVLASLICNIFAIIFTCVPIQAAWNYSIKGKCFKIVDFFYASSSINIATDLALTFLPIPRLWALNRPRTDRIVLCGLFALGIFTCVASVFRLSTLHHTTGAMGAIDFSYSTVVSVNWCIIEVGTAIICTSLASLRPLLTKILPKVFVHISTNASASRRVSGLPSRGRSVKMSNVNHSHSRSESVAWNHGENERGEIVVEQTFQVREEWENAKEKQDQSPWIKTKSEKSMRKMDPRVKDFGNDSEEELVIQKNESYVARNR